MRILQTDFHADTSRRLNRRMFVAGVMTGAGTLLLPGRGPVPSVHPLFAADPPASGLIVHTPVPMNAEPRLPELIRAWITPVESFYIRSHGPNPRIDAASFRVSIEGLVERSETVSVDELSARHEAVSTTVTLTCAGNRRYEHSRIREVAGVPWREGAIGNATWSGVKLSDVLRRAGLKDGASHVWFEGLDEITHGGETIRFGASIPLAQALNDQPGLPGTLLATHMNDQPLTADHGAPLRTVVPGYIGARSVKWLSRIVVSDRPSPNHFVADVYKLVQDGDPFELAETAPIYRFPVNAVICSPEAGQSLRAGTVRVAGYALPTGRPGTRIEQIEVSVDGGRSWSNATVSSPVRELCWVLWQADVTVAASTGELVVRATDSRGYRQPEHVDWNQKGYLFNAWHRVPVRIG